MAKKYPPGYIPDPKKVAAGKARAAQGIKDSSGKYVSRILQNEIAKTVLATKKISVKDIPSDATGRINKELKAAKVTQKQVKEFYEKHPFVFENMIKNAELFGTSKNSNQLEKSVLEYKGKIYIDSGNGKIKEVTKAPAKYEIARFKNYLSSEINVVDFTVQPLLSFDGKQTLQIPNARQLVKDLKTYFGVETADELSEFTGAEITEAIQNILNDQYEGETHITIYAS